MAEDEELVALSCEAGCISWLIGFESICQKTLDDMGKVTNTVEIYKSAVDSIHAHHMAVVGDFMFGFDTDTPYVFDETIKLINDLGIDVADFSILTPFPGTPIFESLKKQGRILSTDWHKYNMHSVVFKPKEMSTTQLMQGVQYLYIRFYNPIETIKRIVKSLKLGLYPFFMVISRNLISMIASQKISRVSKEDKSD